LLTGVPRSGRAKLPVSGASRAAVMVPPGPAGVSGWREGFVLAPKADRNGRGAVFVNPHAWYRLGHDAHRRVNRGCLGLLFFRRAGLHKAGSTDLTIPATLPSRRTAPRSMLAAREQGVYGWFALGERTDPHGHEIHPPPPVMLAVAISKAPVRREVLQPPTNHALARCQSRCAGSIHRYGRGTQVTAWPQGVSGRPERSW
jgi:hypothetical protein